MPEDRPDPSRLWLWAALSFPNSPDERRTRYLELMREHGHLEPAEPGEDSDLPCGWPGA